VPIRLVAFDLDDTLIRGRNSLAVIGAVGDSPRDPAPLSAEDYFSMAVWNCSHWSARGVHVSRSRLA
jgi:FMN phosphatase YigB (HAD superfamily)